MDTLGDLTGKRLSVDGRTFVAEDGFGCSPACLGGKIYGHWEDDGTNGVIRREWVESIVTEIHD